ncbi:MAG: M20/M25/M40 family metallo-hydrolase [Dehalococcoidia bacterium]|nr:M20/M25/M40 family metallo-hydrolase [Dehalococcoidia bacterium]
MTTEAIQQILDSVDREEMLNLAQDLIRIPSFKTEESDVARFLGDYLGERGYEVQLQEVEPGRFQTVAILRGTGGGKSFMLNGHIDIDPLAMGWKRDPWTPSIEGDLIYGGGIRNMKAGVSSLVTAAEAIRKSGVSLQGDLVLACVVGELQGGVGTTYLCQNGPLTDMAVVPEPFGADNILTVHAGVVEMAIHVLGNSRHISRKEEAVDAIAKMCKAVPAIDGVEFTYTPREDLPGLPRINVGGIIGGRGRDYDMRGPNFVSDFCTVIVDVRFLPGMTSASVKADIERALDRIKADDPDFEYEIEMPPDPRYRVFTVVMEPKDEYILDCVLRQYRTVTGREPDGVGTVLPGSYTGDDTCHLWRAGVPCLLYGPGGGSESETIPDEYSRISDMEQVAKVLALTALDVCSLPK